MPVSTLRSAALYHCAQRPLSTTVQPPAPSATLNGPRGGRRQSARALAVLCSHGNEAVEDLVSESAGPESSTATRRRSRFAREVTALEPSLDRPLIDDLKPHTNSFFCALWTKRRRMEGAGGGSMQSGRPPTRGCPGGLPRHCMEPYGGSGIMQEPDPRVLFQFLVLRAEESGRGACKRTGDT
ncbi:hypothetical protein cyc_02661 [Cyclospora cayetanensis]|uniref:Uncharacterized protein n=1 Tax=Cyclospora cayetanensis TaxID=88456 RepID=A0A1D3D0S8_9EIME|nr:hypothetical protein cyc_02661 [Cyclospora cayetanensis]